MGTEDGPFLCPDAISSRCGGRSGGLRVNVDREWLRKHIVCHFTEKSEFRKNVQLGPFYNQVFNFYRSNTGFCDVGVLYVNYSGAWL